MNTACTDMQERIADYVLGGLEAAEAQEVREHLAQCQACREYLTRLEGQDKALIALGQHVGADMEARQERVIEVIANTARVDTRADRTAFSWIRLVRLAAAAMIALAAGIALGRWTGPAPIDVEQLRADMQASVAASLVPVVQEQLLVAMDERLESALSENETEVIEQVRQELQVFGAQLAGNSRKAMDHQFEEFVQLLEAARRADRQRIARAFEQVELNRLRDAQKIGRGLYTLAAQTTEPPASTTN